MEGGQRHKSEAPGLNPDLLSFSLCLMETQDPPSRSIDISRSTENNYLLGRISWYCCVTVSCQRYQAGPFHCKIVSVYCTLYWPTLFMGTMLQKLLITIFLKNLKFLLTHLYLVSLIHFRIFLLTYVVLHGKNIFRFIFSELSSIWPPPGEKYSKESRMWVRSVFGQCHHSPAVSPPPLKGTGARDLIASVFSMDLLYMGSRFRG